MNSSHFIHRHRDSAHRRGFTLVEMLVSVALVLLLMTIFATVFQVATESVRTQRGIAENDSKVRQLTTILRADIGKRSMRTVLPFFPGEVSGTSPTSFGDRSGYFTVSTNRSDNGMDDVLQFTVNSTILDDYSDTTEFVGKGEQLVDRSGTDAPLTDTNLLLSTTLNQPDVDDDNLNANATASSAAAEITYFIRGGNLYRRVLLIRDPIPLAAATLGAQPANSTPTDLFAGLDNSSNYDGQFQLPRLAAGPVRADLVTDDFWRHFDFSAYVDISDKSTPPNTNLDFGAQFIGFDALTNGDNDPLAVSLGKPHYRYGYDFVTGRPREYLSSTGLFMGRFLQAETSASNFNYPQQHSVKEGTGSADPTVLANRLEDNGAAANGNPLDITVEYVTNQYDVISVFDGVDGASSNGRGGPRAVEDLLLANVHEMRIEVFDDRLGRYVPMSHSYSVPGGEAGDYHISRRVNASAGPVHSSVTPAVFDTWHPRFNRDLDLSSTVEDTERHPPYKAYTVYPPAAPDGPSPAGMPAPVPDSINSSTNLDFWQPGVEYAVGDVTFASFANINGINGFEWFSDGAGVVPDGVAPEGFDLIFECVAIDDPDSNNLGFTGGTEPTWSHTPGRLVTDNQVTWLVRDNRRPLKSIRIQLRFMNQQSGRMRQLTLDLSLQDES